MSGISMPVTRNPSFTSCPRTLANSNLPEPARDEARDEHRNEVRRPVDHTGHQTVRGEADAKHLDESRLPRLERQRATRDRQVGLVAGVVHRHHDATGQSDDDRHHHPLEIESVADVGRSLRDLSGREQDGVLRFPQRMQRGEPTAFLEWRLCVSSSRRRNFILPSPAGRVRDADAARSRSSPNRRTCKRATSSSSSSRQPSSSARSTSSIASARISAVGMRSSGMTFSNIPIGTIARGEPLVVVVKAKRRPGTQADTKVRMVENELKPGPSHPMNTRVRSSPRTEICW